ncbi:addiction module antidote protein [Methylocapsa aurea]|uniref:addiction module antidote protein n=1 Tax=Methylocapsa aurea TaxID=663610 RepID=UPI003D18F802
MAAFEIDHRTIPPAPHPGDHSPADPREKFATEPQVELLAEAFASGDQKYIAAALGAIARARGMSTIAENAGVTRPALYKALSETGDPQLSTLLGVVNALGLKRWSHWLTLDNEALMSRALKSYSGTR